jgi:hypothetical protein
MASHLEANNCRMRAGIRQVPAGGLPDLLGTGQSRTDWRWTSTHLRGLLEGRWRRGVHWLRWRSLGLAYREPTRLSVEELEILAALADALRSTRYRSQAVNE